MLQIPQNKHNAKIFFSPIDVFRISPIIIIINKAQRELTIIRKDFFILFIRTSFLSII